MRAVIGSEEGSAPAREPRRKVLFVTPWFPRPERPLEGLFIREHARAVGLYDDVVILHCAGLDSHLRALSRMDEEREAELTGGLRTFRVWYRRSPIPETSYLLYIWSVWQAVGALQRQGFFPDVLHAHVYEAAMPTVITGRLRRIPTVITEHYSAFPRRLLARQELMKARLAFRWADLVLPVSMTMQRGLEAAGIRASYRVIPNPVDPALFFPPSTARAPGPVRLLFVGRLLPEKGATDLLEAVSGLRDHGDWHLGIIGGGPHLDAYQQQAAAMGLADRVTFHGPVRHEQVAVSMREADIFVLPSRFETFSVVTAEALMSGTPVVVTQCGGPEEFVVPSVGTLVPPDRPEALAAAIGTMIDHLADYPRERIAAYASERFSAPVVGAALHAVYDGLAGSGRRRTPAALRSAAQRVRRWMIVRRSLLWATILRRVRGRSMAGFLGLLASAALDLARVAVSGDGDGPAIARFDLEVTARDTGVRFAVRAGTDDLYHVLPRREGDVHDAILSPLCEGDVFVDVGANIGYYALTAAKRVGPRGHVVAIEPVPETCASLRTNVTLNGVSNVSVVEAAAFRVGGGRVEMHVRPQLSGRATIHGRAAGGPLVPTVMLDEVCRAFPRVRMLKIDVEGAEESVLLGARDLLARTESVVLEWSGSPQPAVRLLESAGFTVCALEFTTHLLAHRGKV